MRGTLRNRGMWVHTVYILEVMLGVIHPNVYVKRKKDLSYLVLACTFGVSSPLSTLVFCSGAGTLQIRSS
jgi:hypothetical protein